MSADLNAVADEIKRRVQVALPDIEVHIGTVLSIGGSPYATINWSNVDLSDLAGGASYTLDSAFIPSRFIVMVFWSVDKTSNEINEANERALMGAVGALSEQLAYFKVDGLEVRALLDTMASAEDTVSSYKVRVLSVELELPFDSVSTG